ncbi:DUF3794 domain-containing protein [Inediibacterium massiliense]|uniref:DUF3794 domain-containing protein n=1 Tax=Inediibacterium massiliense TaxID=1658111 RepID=UPI0006B59351|nr:DUF3794 domain-containing protein [Inediibacterium massiliense]
MATVVKGLIEYDGLTNFLPKNPKAFKEFIIEEEFEIPEMKPDIEQIVKVSAKIEIIDKTVIQTPVSMSLEGQKLTGWKLVVEGEVHQKIEYVADEPTQKVHAVHKVMPFSTFIVLSRNHKQEDAVMVVPYIEDIFVMQRGKRNIFKNITILLDAIQK